MHYVTSFSFELIHHRAHSVKEGGYLPGLWANRSMQGSPALAWANDIAPNHIGLSL